MNIVAAIKSRLNRLRLITRRYLSRHHYPSIPQPPVWQYPQGMQITTVENTGVRVIDNFLTPEEAQAIIDSHGKELLRSTVRSGNDSFATDDYRTSSNRFIPLDADQLILSVVHRATSLLGLPIGHAEKFSLTRYQQGEYYKKHYDHDGSLHADRLYTVLIYLNDLDDEDGGGTCFENLNLVCKPVRGRALVWVNSTDDGYHREDSLHSALPVLTEGKEKWVVQLWFRRYPWASPVKPATISDPAEGQSLDTGSALPKGVFLATR